MAPAGAQRVSNRVLLPEHSVYYQCACQHRRSTSTATTAAARQAQHTKRERDAPPDGDHRDASPASRDGRPRPVSPPTHARGLPPAVHAADQCPPAPPSRLGLWSLYQLYYCAACRRLHCPHCTQRHVAAYYCPTCLFEVSHASMKAEKHRCARACFSCPLCTNVLTIVAATASAAGARSSASASASASISASALAASTTVHTLVCGVCRWTSQSIDLNFDRPTGLSAQMTQGVRLAPDLCEFDHLRGYYDTLLRQHASAAERGRSGTTPGGAELSHRRLPFTASMFQNLPGLAGPSGDRSTVATAGGGSSLMGSSSSSSSALRRRDRIPPYEPLAPPDPADVPAWLPTPHFEDEPTVKAPARGDARGLPLGLLQRTTLVQCLAQPELVPRHTTDLLPQRMRLAARWTHQCRDCAAPLLRPEAKASAAGHRTRHVALNWLPHIGVTRVVAPADRAARPPDDDDPDGALDPASTVVHATFQNPTDAPMTIELLCPLTGGDGGDGGGDGGGAVAGSGPAWPCEVQLPAATFTCGAFTASPTAAAPDGLEAEDPFVPFPGAPSMGQGAESSQARATPAARAAALPYGVVAAHGSSTTVKIHVRRRRPTASLPHGTAAPPVSETALARRRPLHTADAWIRTGGADVWIRGSGHPDAAAAAVADAADAAAAAAAAAMDDEPLQFPLFVRCRIAGQPVRSQGSAPEPPAPAHDAAAPHEVAFWTVLTASPASPRHPASERPSC